MFNLVKEGEPGWTPPSEKEKLRRYVRFFLGLNPYCGATQVDADMSVKTFMMRMGTYDQLMKDVMTFLLEKQR